MPTLTYSDGKKQTDLMAIRKALKPLGVELDHWPASDAWDAQHLLAQDSLTSEEKELVLEGYKHRFDHLAKTAGYKTQDLIVIHGAIPGLDEMLAKFDKAHYHTDPEVRYIVDGEGVFGFVMPDGEQVELTVVPGDYISVPENTEHWFHLTEKRRIKAVRYFVDESGWTPHYTGTKLAFQW